jgi:tetratricopeptide (TPR) repeat protein
VFLTAAWHFARGMAFVATGRMDDADRSLAALTLRIADPQLDAPLFSPNSGRAIMSIAPAVLAGEIAAGRGDFDRAIAHLEHGVRLEDALVYTEPAEWAFPVRHALGAVLLEAGRASEAETVYWEDLKRNRENGWALTGLVQALRAQKKDAQAAVVDARRATALARADVTLTGSRFGRAPVAASAAVPAFPVTSVALAHGVVLPCVEHAPATGTPVIGLQGVTDSRRSFEDCCRSSRRPARRCSSPSAGTATPAAPRPAATPTWATTSPRSWTRSGRRRRPPSRRSASGGPPACGWARAPGRRSR